jgi:16S rRNA (cytosine1402-N4)-methyltransferase
MTTRSSDFQHVSVLLREVVAAFEQAPAGWVVDATLGGGGHSAALLEAWPQLNVLGLDRDPAALAAATSRLAGVGPRFRAVHAPFSQLAAVVEAQGLGPLSGVLADLGVSSHQLDSAARGFSFRFDGPLDMRMDPSRGVPLLDKLASVTLEELADVLYLHGDIRRSIGTARQVLEGVRLGADTTGKLADWLAKRLPRERSHHPATAVFQALRIWVNDEAGELATLLRDAPGLLGAGGVLAVISFHSGEDRAVKHALRELAPKRYQPDWIRPADQAPQADELNDNPRARSARLRCLLRHPGNREEDQGI